MWTKISGYLNKAKPIALTQAKNKYRPIKTFPAFLKAGTIMNKIKMFLSIAVLSMAVAGAFATKNTKWNAQSFYYVINGSSCDLVQVQTNCTIGGPGCETPDGKQIYLTKNSSDQCIDPAKD